MLRTVVISPIIDKYFVVLVTPIAVRKLTSTDERISGKTAKNAATVFNQIVLL